MIKFESTEVVGWEAAIRGMRNPMNSWEKSDSIFLDADGNYYTINESTGPCNIPNIYTSILGKADFDLMMRLRKAGTEHRKFMRMIVVYVDIIAPLYWWKEFDTYKVGTVANSCSTMHKIADREFTFGDFSCEHLEGFGIDSLKATIEKLNWARDVYNNGANYEDFDRGWHVIPAKIKTYWLYMIQLLPSSYNQRRTIMLNYEVLANIYKSRRNHKLDEWHEFCHWIEGLPYSTLITGEREEGNTDDSKS